MQRKLRLSRVRKSGDGADTRGVRAMVWLPRADVTSPEATMRDVAASEGMVGLERVTRLFREEEWSSLSGRAKARSLEARGSRVGDASVLANSFAGLGRTGYF